MVDQDEADQRADGTPQQVQGKIAEGDAFLAVDGVGSLEEVLLPLPLVPQFDLPSIDLWPPSLSPSGARRGIVRCRRRPDSGHEVVAFCKERLDDLPACIVRVGQEYTLPPHYANDLEKEGNQLVQESTLVAIRPDEAFVDAADQGNAEKVPQGVLYEHSQGLEGMAHDELGFGVVL